MKSKLIENIKYSIERIDRKLDSITNNIIRNREQLASYYIELDKETALKKEGEMLSLIYNNTIIDEHIKYLTNPPIYLRSEDEPIDKRITQCINHIEEYNNETKVLLEKKLQYQEALGLLEE